jgi:tetratricopeptide (TPR) repeat protein
MNNIDAQKALERSYVSSIENTEYDEALKLAEMLCLLDPNNPEYSHKIAYVYLKELKWEEAIEAELKTLELDAQYIPALDLLAHAYGGIGNWERSGFYGNLALELKDKAIPVPTQEMVPAPALKNGKRIIAFSLFGNNPKYVEPAILNTQVSPMLFPGWVCRFYVDDSVSSEAIQRLKNNGAEVIYVTSPVDKWPGAMWRFLAINDPEAEYVIFRDADSVVSHREGEAVAEWIESGRSFHTMRDSGSHTALILAGMWGYIRQDVFA